MICYTVSVEQCFRPLSLCQGCLITEISTLKRDRQAIVSLVPVFSVLCGVHHSPFKFLVVLKSFITGEGGGTSVSINVIKRDL